MGSAAPRTVDVLDDAECRRLLTTVPIGRMAFTEGALPTIQPVHFIVRNGWVVIPTRAGSKMEAASREAVVAFEVDAYDVGTRTGWNVTVIGPSRVARDAAEVGALDALGAEAWAPADNPCYILIELTVVRGRRIRITDPDASHPDDVGPA